MARRQRALNRRQFLSSLVVAGVGITRSGTLAAATPASVWPTRAGADWPLYRHDAALTGVSAGIGRIAQPRVRWEYYLGSPYEPIATVRSPHDAPLDPRSTVVDLDGDGRLERIVIDGRTLRITDLAGATLWTHTVTGLPLGGNVRVCQVLSDAPRERGYQVIAFSSRMDTGEGQGYCFDFRRGAANGELVWTTGPLTGQHAPTLIVDDVDGDGRAEIITAPHYRVQIWNAQTGVLKAEIPWDVGRNYGALLTRPRGDRPQKDIYIVSDFVLHVDCIRYGARGWAHTWGHKYVDPSAPARSGREKYLRVGPTPVVDVDGDGRDEVVYMLVDATDDDRWHLRVRDAESGDVKSDVAGVWLWSMADLDGDGRLEIVYTPTTEKRPTTYCDVHIGRLGVTGLTSMAVLRRVRPVMTRASLPLGVDTIADEGVLDVLRADLDGGGVAALFHARPGDRAGVEDVLEASSFAANGRTLTSTWRFTRPGHRLNLVTIRRDGAERARVTVRDLTAGRALTIDAAGAVVDDAELGRPGGFVTTPIVADIDGDGRNEIVVQNAAAEIVALRPGHAKGDPPTILWSVPGMAMSHSPGYAWNGELSPQAADVDGDGHPEVVFASEDERGHAAVTCVDGHGQLRWRRSIDGCVWGGLQAGVDLWTFGRFTGRPRGLDVYVDLHRRSKGSGEGWVLHGATGEVVWRRAGLVAKETAMPFGGGLPAVADIDGDGHDELVQMFYTVYGAVSGRTGEPLFPPALLWRPEHLGQWIAYSWPTVADLNGDGHPEVYLNRAAGAYAAIHVDGTRMWARFHNNDLAPTGSGPVGDLDGDGACEVAVPVQNGTLLCLNAADGTPKWTRRTPVAGDVVAADVDGDGALELVFAAHDGTIRAVRGRDGQELWAIPASGRPVIADVDGDGFVEIVAVGGDGILRVIG